LKITPDTVFSKWKYLSIAAVVLFGISFLFTERIADKSAVSRETAKLQLYIHRLQQDFARFAGDTSLVTSLAQNRESLQQLLSLSQKKYGIYLYRKNEYGEEMLFWNNQMVTPREDIYRLPDGEYFRQLQNGYYVCEKRTTRLQQFPDSLVMIAMIPVKYEYFVETDYLPEQFTSSPQAASRIVISAHTAGNSIVSLKGNTLFYVEGKASSSIPSDAPVVVWLRSISLALFLLFIYLVSERIVFKKGIWFGVVFLALCLLALRISSYFFTFPFSLRQFDLFDPAIYGSNSVNKSLGDLLINSVLFWWISVFTWSKAGDKEVKLNRFSKWGIPIAVLSSAAFVFFSFSIADLIRGLVADSKISFDVTDFFSLNIYSVIGFVVLAALSLGYYYFSRLFFRIINAVFSHTPFFIYLITAFTGLSYLTINFGDPKTRFFLMVLLWLMGYTLLLSRQQYFINRFRVSIAGVLFWIFIFSMSLSAIIISENGKKEWETRKLLASRLATQADPTLERQLSIALTYLDNDFLLGIFPRFYNPVENSFLRDSILRSSGYMDKYDTRLFVFDANGQGLYNKDPESYNTLNTIFNVQARPTQIPGFYYYETTYDRFTFIVKREVRDTTGALTGSVFIVSNPKQYGSDALYPELFRQKSFDDLANYPLYSFAVYKNGNLVSPFNKYPFAISLSEKDVPANEFNKVVNGDFDELWYKAASEKIVVIARKRDSVIGALTLFSYIFCSFLFMVALLQFISLLIRMGYNRRELKKFFQLNIRSQIHSIVIMVSVISFIIIGIATISFFINRFERNNTDKLSRTMRIMVNEMQKRLINHRTFDDVVKIYDSVSNSDIQRLVEEVSEIHNVDVNVYDLKGNLYVSSQPLVYQEGFLSMKIHPVGYFHLNRLRQVQHVQEEQMGKLNYLSIYAPVRDENGQVDAYLNIPYFLSQRELQQEISNFLVTIINLNAFIFLIAGVIALVITNRITRSFSLISERMQEINLGKTNEEIEWHRDDEIGGLVKEYNKMVKKLEESAVALAKSEREGAWREMARQVAHEIKNPLTPMKLSIQYLQKAIDGNPANVKELSANVARTLVEQIDHLSRIAADFSQFANIGNINIERFDLHEIIASLNDLYKTNPRVDFIWNKSSENLIIESDKTQMNRLFTNLIQNAVEASEAKPISIIELTESVYNGSIRISISDNGEGIPEAMWSKIFVPNFTTKSSGTGLGLAMCKSIVEQSNGRIWFQTETGRGSTFFVELPAVN